MTLRCSLSVSDGCLSNFVENNFLILRILIPNSILNLIHSSHSRIQVGRNWPYQILELLRRNDYPSKVYDMSPGTLTSLDVVEVTNYPLS